MHKVIEEEGFAFHQTQGGMKVFVKRKELGEIATHQEPNGRHCFRLGPDTRKKPRTYRGKVTAAKALQALDELLKAAKSEKLGTTELILRAWENVPSSV